MLKLKLQYFGHLMGRADSLEKTLMLGKTEGRRIRRQQRMCCLNGITDSKDMSLSKLWEIAKDREAYARATVPWVTKSWTQLSDWTMAARGLWMNTGKQGKMKVFKAEWLCEWWWQFEKFMQSINKTKDLSPPVTFRSLLSFCFSLWLCTLW